MTLCSLTPMFNFMKSFRINWKRSISFLKKLLQSFLMKKLFERDERKGKFLERFTSYSRDCVGIFVVSNE